MKTFISLDIETTGLDEHKCQILEFGAVIGDFGTEEVFGLPFFKRRFKYDEIHGEPYAIALNAGLIKDMAGNVGPWSGIQCLWNDFMSFCKECGFEFGSRIKPTVTGKNIGSFDRRFLALAPLWQWEQFSHRYLDVGSLYFDPITDLELPNTLLCASRAGVDVSRFKLHEAVDDARLVVEIIRSYYKGK